MFLTWNRYVCIHNLYQVEPQFIPSYSFMEPPLKRCALGQKGLKPSWWFPKSKLQLCLQNPKFCKLIWRAPFLTLPRPNAKKESLRTSAFTTLPSVVDYSLSSLMNLDSFYLFTDFKQTKLHPRNMKYPWDIIEASD